MNIKTNRQAINDVLMERAKNDSNIVVVCSDSRGSASMSTFAQTYPEQFVEMGIAEQNLVTVSAGLASCGKKVFAASPASFLSTRSYEQAKIDVAYSETNVTLIGISGGISYGALGLTHHSCQDFAAFCALPGMRVYAPCDHFQTTKLIEALLEDDKPAYVRVSRNASEEVYDENIHFELNKANILEKGEDILIVSCGEMTAAAIKAQKILKDSQISAGVIDVHSLKPLDEETILREAEKATMVFTVEEHSPYGGLGSIVSQFLGANCPKKIINLSLPDGHIITGTNKEAFKYYGLDGEGIAKKIMSYWSEE